MKLYEYQVTFHTDTDTLEVLVFSENYTQAYYAFLRIENEHNRKPNRFEFKSRPKRTGKIYYEFPFEKAIRYFKAWRLKRARKKKVAQR